MSSRTIQTGEDIDSALEFLASEAEVSPDDYLLDKINVITKSILDEADSKRFEMVKALLDEKNKGQSISKLRELLGA